VALGDWADVDALLRQNASANSRHVVLASNLAQLQWREFEFSEFPPDSPIPLNPPANSRHELFTPLIAACSHNRPEILDKLLKIDGIAVNAINLHSQTALMYAAACGNLRLILLLLEAGAGRSVVDKKGRSAVDWAMLKGMKMAGEVIRCDPRAYTLVDCARNDDAEGVEALVIQGFDVNRKDYGEPAVVAAAKAASLGVLGRLAKSSGLDFEGCDDNGETALVAACRLGHVDVVLFLLKLGAKRSPEASALAAEKGHVLCGVIVNTDFHLVVLHDACALGKLLQVEALLMQGVRVNAADQRAGRSASTPLMAAAACAGGGRRGKAVRIVVDRLLREPGVKINAKNSQGATCLMIAAANGSMELCKTLIREGADKNSKDSRGRGAVWWAYNGTSGSSSEPGGEGDANLVKSGMKNASNYLRISAFVRQGVGRGEGAVGEEYRRSIQERRRSSVRR